MAKAQNIPLIPISASSFDCLRNRDDVATPAGETPVLGDDFNSPDPAYAYAGFCEKFNLSDDSDRLKYAELSAKLYAGAEFIRLWEDRLPVDGNINVFVAYIKVLKVFQDGNKLDLNHNIG